MRMRRAGFTLVEVLVAVVLIDVGMLALIAGSAVLIRQTAEMRARAAAVRAAANRLQLLGASCVVRSGRAGGPFGIREDWSVTLQSDGVRELRDSVTYASASGVRTVVLRTRLPC
jgi:type II secretory pathway component PulJ